MVITIEPSEIISMEDWLMTPCEYCGLALAYCSCAEGDDPEEVPR